MNNEKKRIIRSKLLEKYPKIHYSFGTKHENKESHDVITPHQVHGDKVMWVDGEVSYEADGLITDKRGITIGVRTADCAPILLYEPVKRIIGIVHAGWKGTAAGIARKAVDMVVNYGGSEERLVVVIGPHIGPCCYRVDLGAMNKQQLIHAGVLEKHIDMISDCTAHRADLFYSHRRDGKARNNRHMVNFIELT